MIEIIKTKPREQILSERLTKLRELLKTELAGEQPSILYISDLKENISALKENIQNKRGTI